MSCFTSYILGVSNFLKGVPELKTPAITKRREYLIRRYQGDAEARQREWDGGREIGECLRVLKN